MSRANLPAQPCTRNEPWTASDGVVVGTHDVAHSGLTIREHFAGLAMQAIIGTAAAPCLTSFDGCEPNIAATAVGMADALIAELSKAVTP